MKTPLNVSLAYVDESQLRRLFSWLTRIGATPKFGTLPIAWYQLRQCACIDFLRVGCGDLVRMRKGFIQKRKNQKWQNFLTPLALDRLADAKVRA